MSSAELARRYFDALAHPAFNQDTGQARASIHKPAALNPSAAWPGHSDPVTADVEAQLERAASG
jgi:hydroxyacylglutathione hydrolase